MIDNLYTIGDKNDFYLGMISQVYKNSSVVQVENLSWLKFRKIRKELLIPNTINFLVVVESTLGVFLGEVYQSKLPNSDSVHSALLKNDSEKIYPELSIDIIGVMSHNSNRFKLSGFATVGLTDRVYIANKKIIDIFENISQNKEDITGINIRLLDILKNQEKFILFVNLQITLDIFFEKVKFFSFEIGKEYSFTKIVEFLVENGYENSYLIEKKGQYSRRGDILDIFPPDLENPVRLEFFGDELESIRFFDIDSQISVEKIKKIKIFGNLLSGNNYELIELIDELKAEDITIVIENEELLDYKMEEFILLDRNREEIYRKRYENLKKKSIFVQTKNFSQEQIETFRDKNRLEKLSKIEDIYIFTNNYEKKMAEFGQILTEKENNLEIEKYELFEGFIFNDNSENPDNKNRKNNFIVLTDRELDGYIYERKKKTAKAIKYKKINQIIEGDYVIHVQYGVGIYKGIETIEEMVI